MKIAVCTLISKDDNILVVARKDNPDHFGLPGGKREGSEDLIQTAIRECQEETGLTPYNLKLLYDRVFITEDDVFWTYTFTGEVDNFNLDPLKGEAEAKWGTWDDLLSGPFKEYSQELKYILDNNIKRFTYDS